MSKYELSYIELFNPIVHGDINDLNIKEQNMIFSNYLLMDKMKPDKFLLSPKKLMKHINKSLKYYKLCYESNIENNNIYANNCDVEIRNIKKIIEQTLHGKLGIIERVNYHTTTYGNSFEYTFAIDKTFWLKIFQRRWKKIYENKLSIIKKMHNLKNLQYREIHGKWSFNTNIYNI